MEDKMLEELGWWIAITPLSRLEPEEWICGIYKKGKKSWITEACKSEFEDPYSARVWAIEWIKATDPNVAETLDADLFWHLADANYIGGLTMPAESSVWWKNIKKEQEDAKKKNN